MKIIARHKWVDGAIITESVDETDDRIRRYTATIRGFRNWKIFQGRIASKTIESKTIDSIIEDVKKIRDRIDAGDDTIFHSKQGF